MKNWLNKSPLLNLLILALASMGLLALVVMTAKYWMIQVICVLALIAAAYSRFRRVNPKLATVNPQTIVSDFIYFAFLKLKVYIISLPEPRVICSRLQIIDNGPAPIWRVHLIKSPAFDGSAEMCGWLRDVLNLEVGPFWAQMVVETVEPLPLVVTQVQTFGEELLADIVFTDSPAARMYADDLLARGGYCHPAASAVDDEF